MEYCLSTVNEFLNDIRTFQNLAVNRKSTNAIWSDSSEQDDDINSDDTRLAPSLDINELVRGFVNQLLQALLALHEHYIVHCDVKGDNIFISNINGHYIVKLGVCCCCRCFVNSIRQFVFNRISIYLIDWN